MESYSTELLPAALVHPLFAPTIGSGDAVDLHAPLEGDWRMLPSCGWSVIHAMLANRCCDTAGNANETAFEKTVHFAVGDKFKVWSVSNKCWF